MHDQWILGGVSLLPEQCGGDDAQTPAMAGGEESAAAEHAISWDVAASAWVAAGRQLKPEEVWTQLRGALLQVRPGVDAAAWEAVSYAEKKELLTSICATGRKAMTWRQISLCLCIHPR